MAKINVPTAEEVCNKIKKQPTADEAVINWLNKEFQYMLEYAIERGRYQFYFSPCSVEYKLHLYDIELVMSCIRQYLRPLGYEITVERTSVCISWKNDWDRIVKGHGFYGC